MRRQITSSKNRNSAVQRRNWSTTQRPQRYFKSSVQCIILIAVSISTTWTFLNKSPLPSEDKKQQDEPNKVMDYEASLLQLRCFTTPGCFPTVKCRQKGTTPQKIARRFHWEEQAFCTDDLSHDSSSAPADAKAAGKQCLVYSFGVYESYEWEAKVAKFFRCEVHAFDPTMTFSSNVAPGVTFHQLGLQGIGTNMSATHAERYEAIDETLLLSLEDIRKKLGHENRTIDVLMLDCEGCEWGVLRQLACTGGETTLMVKQIVTEFHFQLNLGLQDERDVQIAAEAVSCLYQDRWAVTSIETNKAGWREWKYARGVSSVIHSESFLMLMSLRRIPNHEKMPHELLEEYATAKRVRSLEKRVYMKEYGDNVALWPEEVRENLAGLYVKEGKAKDAMEDVVWKRAVFDDHPRMAEEKVGGGNDNSA